MKRFKRFVFDFRWKSIRLSINRKALLFTRFLSDFSLEMVIKRPEFKTRFVSWFHGLSKTFWTTNWFWLLLHIFSSLNWLNNNWILAQISETLFISIQKSLNKKMYWNLIQIFSQLFQTKQNIEKFIQQTIATKPMFLLH